MEYSKGTRGEGEADMIGYLVCGGLGTRVAELCSRYNCTKENLPVGGHRFSEYEERRLLDSGIVSTVHYLRGKQIGTGGELRSIGTGTSNPYVAVYGDMYVDYDLAPLYASYLLTRADLLIVTMETSDQDYGMVLVDTDNRVVGYSRKHDYVTSYLTNVGMYLVGERMHNLLTNYPQPDPLSLESDILENPSILGGAAPIFDLMTIVSYRVNSNRVFDIGLPSRYAETCDKLRW
jgi:NDP-sugar pyrophosphorylase family protein